MRSNPKKFQFFSFRLFLEALKRLRVIGLATGIPAVTISALVPVVFWIEGGVQSPLVGRSLCVPAVLVVLLAPFFFFELFSFLQKRKESDFFHAIPYTRTCVYVSFVAAALIFVWVIQLVCALVAGALWSIVPMAKGLTPDLGGMATYVLVSMLAAAMLSGFMMLALTLSGTGGSCILLFALFAAFVRVVFAIFLSALDTVELIATEVMWESSFLSPLWFLPINVFYSLGNLEQGATCLFYGLPNLLYSAVVTLVIFGLAGLLYKHRRSEMAGEPAPGVRTQALFRILFTILPALLIPLLLLQYSSETSLILVIVVVVLLFYFLYELVTTRRPRNMLKAIPGLGIVVGACVVFVLLFYAYRGVVLYESIDKSRIQSVSMESNGFNSHSYQGRLLGTVSTDDEKVIALVARQLEKSQKYERGEIDEKPIEYWNRVVVTIRTKGGRTIRRRVVMREEMQSELQAQYAYTDEFKDILFLLPKDQEIHHGQVYMGGPFAESVNLSSDIGFVMETFRREYATLSHEEKLEVLSPMMFGSRENTYLMLTLRGNTQEGGYSYSADYLITPALPQTSACLVAAWGAGKGNHLSWSLGRDSKEEHIRVDEESVAKTLEAFRQGVEQSELAAALPVLGGRLSLCFPARGEGRSFTVELDAKQYLAFVELLLDTNLISSDGVLKDTTAAKDTCMVVIDLSGEDARTGGTLWLYCTAVLELPPERYSELMSLLKCTERE